MSIDEFIEPGASPRKKVIKISEYAPEDIAHLLREGRSDEEIYSQYKITPEYLASIKAHIKMGTYGRGRLRELSDDETKRIYQDIKNGMSSDEMAKKYGITRIRIMGFKAAYTLRMKRNKKKR